MGGSEALGGSACERDHALTMPMATNTDATKIGNGDAGLRRKLRTLGKSGSSSAIAPYAANVKPIASNTNAPSSRNPRRLNTPQA